MITIVIPVFNEQDSLAVLNGELCAIVKEANLDVEILMVDDGSTDRSWGEITRLARENPDLIGLRFRRNFGKAAALLAGFRRARGDIIITMDSDLQDDPREIPGFLRAMDAGLDVVSGWKRVRCDPWHKVWPSRVFNIMVTWLTGVRLHDHNCGMKAYRAQIFREISLYGELHRLIPVLAAARGYRTGEIEVHHRPRRFGKSKYGMARFLKGFLDLLTVKFLTGYGQRPQHILGGIGLVSFLAGMCGLAYLAATWLVRLWHETAFLPLHERPLLIYSVAALLLGGQMMSIGFLAELIIANQARDEEIFSIAEMTPPFSATAKPKSPPHELPG
jgi:glycosyltransferase involved in cell wall biosynthesis